MFSRTQNENETYDTRCLYCFMTIATAVESEAKLDALESHHICPEKALAEILEVEKAKDRAVEAADSTRPLPN